MRVTVMNYSFPFREDLGAWIIIWEQLGGSEGYVRLQATLTPNLKKMIDFMVGKSYLNSINAHMIYNAATLGMSIQADAYSVNIINGIIRFCESKKQIIKKRSFSWLAALDMGNTTRTDKCIKAIKKDLVLEGEETLGNQLLSYLKSNGINLRYV